VAHLRLAGIDDETLDATETTSAGPAGASDLVAASTEPPDPPPVRRLRRPRPVTSAPRPEDDAAMLIALEEARTAVVHGDVPVGAVVVSGSEQHEVLARRHNERQLSADPTAHAEILALRDAARLTGSWHLDGCTLVVTLEPCPRCAGALVAARVDRVVFGAPDPRAGACGSLYNIATDPRLNHEVEVVSGVRAAESVLLLEGFFEERRQS
jgi:tRNA(adenine34) deaminase